MAVELSFAQLAAGLEAERKFVSVPVDVLDCRRWNKDDSLAAQALGAEPVLPAVELRRALPLNSNIPRQS